MNNAMGKLINKNFDWWIELYNGKQSRIYSMQVYNFSDWYIKHKGKKYGVSIDTKNMTAQIEYDREIF